MSEVQNFSGGPRVHSCWPSVSLEHEGHMLGGRKAHQKQNKIANEFRTQQITNAPTQSARSRIPEPCVDDHQL